MHIFIDGLANHAPSPPCFAYLRYAWCQTILLGLVLFQIFAALQPARHYWRYLNDLALTTSFGGYNKQPWLYVELPVFGRGAEGKQR